MPVHGELKVILVCYRSDQSKREDSVIEGIVKGKEGWIVNKF